MDRTFQGVRRMFTTPRLLSVEPIEIPEPFRYYNLIQLLRPSSHDITLMHEATVMDSDPTVYPHKYFLRVQLAESDRGQRTFRTLDVVAKVLGVIPPDNVEKINIHHKMEKEIKMYSNVIKELDQYQVTWIFRDVKYSDLFPVCYGCAFSTENSNAQKADASAAILLQNLHTLGFEKFLEPCNYDLAKLIIKRLALFHATPIAMFMHLRNCHLSRSKNHMNSRTRFERRNVLKELRRISLVITPESDMYRYMGVIDYHLQRYSSNVHGDYVTEVRSWTTICHSQCSLRNIRYKPADHNGPANVKFLDIGYMEFDSCASDLAFFMLTSMAPENLEFYFNDLVQIYYTEFSRYMSLAYIELEAHTYENFLIEFEKRVVCNIGAILFEIGRLHFDDGDGSTNVMGMSYRAKLDYVIRFMVRKNWIKI